VTILGFGYNLRFRYKHPCHLLTWYVCDNTTHCALGNTAKDYNIVCYEEPRAVKSNQFTADREY
jgi:hypothetical protein